MHGLSRFTAWLCVLLVCGVLSGCMAAHSVVAPMLQSGIRTAAEVNATPESMGVSTAEYRGRDCASLKELADALNIEKTKPEHEALVARAIGWRVDAIHQVRAEQGCDNSAQARPATVAQVVASTPKPGAAGVPAQGAFRARFDPVTPAFAQSLGLESPGGALVIEVEKGSTAEKAGLRALDVVMEVGGQAVQTPADLQAIVGRMRPGYKAAVRVWRQKVMRDMVVEVAAPATTR